ncbi:integrase catalytic domain-containing protein [Trichonephila clavipes]|nr:integrase catalytic domain-containing protein [Trichonephila clavipes]
MERNLPRQTEIQLFSAEENRMELHSPASPHFGGLWEANIKVHETHFIEGSKISYHELRRVMTSTLMAQIEAVLNSRPLSPLSSDPNDLNPLTPGHFLTNYAISSFPEPYTASILCPIIPGGNSFNSRETNFGTVGAPNI